MKVKKPNWTPLELNAKADRHRDLIHETDSHPHDCQCNLCMELHGLDVLVNLFSEDEHAGAVIAARKKLEAAAFPLLKACRKALRLRTIECCLLTSEKLGVLERRELRREGASIEDEIRKAIEMATGIN